MAMLYFSMPMLCELSNERFLAMIKTEGTDTLALIILSKLG
jgi:hypothetical protein